MKNPILLIVIVIAIVAAGAVFFMQSGAPLAPAEVPNDTPIPVEPPGFETGGEAVAEHTVRYTEDGFSPSTLTVPVGTMVTFINESDREMWVASDQHPSHTAYSGTSRSEHCVAGAAPSFDQCARGASYVFTFDKAGTWQYHDHVNAQYKGTIVVE